MSRELESQESIVVGVNLEFRYAAGEAASRFLTALRDEQRIFGTRCPTCQRVLVPARSFCPRCNLETAEWLEVGPTGALKAAVVVDQPDPHHPSSSPFAYGLIRLDGADTNFVHILGEIPLDKISVGIRLEAVFAENRNGDIRDIVCFRPI